MATMKTNVAPLEEQVSKAEDVLQESVEQVVEQPEVVEEVAAEERIPQLDKEQVLATLAERVGEEPTAALKAEVEALKVAFYKLHRADMEARRRAFFEENGADAEYKPEIDEAEVRFKELYNIYRSKRDEATAISDKEKEENYQVKLAIIEELKQLLDSEETLNTTFAKFHDLQARWRAVGQVPQARVSDLYETYNLHVERFYDYVKINKELRDLDWKRNLEAKSALCEQAEALTSATAIVEAFHKLQKLHEEWREVGPVALEHKESLWSRFKAASSIINRRHQEHFEAIKAEQVQNFERKSALCEEIEAMVASAPTALKAWNKASERLQQIQQEWRTIGFAPKRENTKVYDRFRAACDKFFEAKHKFYAEVKSDMDSNLEVKTLLCERAEAIAERDDWAKATEELLALQAEWKQSGAVSRKYADAIWKRFRAACDKFFERKSQHFSEKDSEYNTNLEAKRALLEEMAAAQVGSFDEIKEYQRRWSEIGFVPIKHKDALQKEYKAVLDKLFGAVRGADRAQQMSRFKEKVSAMKSAGDKRLRSERERLYNRVKQLEQEVLTLENNIGFFAKSKGAEALIADVEEKIAKAKREMADAVERVKLIDLQE
ncbi:MAG: DUF349 domain-containing protein [Rikenellaceae bacterium]|nr:DUF349 domain-containing protein [Rikenellaceae bacterium]